MYRPIPSRFLSDQVLRSTAFVTLGPALRCSGTLVTQVGHSHSPCLGVIKQLSKERQTHDGMVPD
jgi:hypothetical protein